jgi:hypothetical protein
MSRDGETRELSDAQIEKFLTDGYVVIEGALDRTLTDEWIASCYYRLGIDPEDRSTWKVDRVHMGGTKSLPMAEIAPRAWKAACELLGGEEAIHPCYFSDHFIVNLGERADVPWQAAGPDCPGWHKDGDFFLHFLDSPEQGLLTLVLWTDVVHQGGPTYLATDSVGVIARYLAAHPEGVEPNGFDFRERIRECERFAEATGKAGDIYLIHPYALHAVSQNVLRVPRVITNPPISLREPMRFNQENPSLVEQAILRGLGVERYDFEPKAPRRKIVPHRVAEQERLMEEERIRLAGQVS